MFRFSVIGLALLQFVFGLTTHSPSEATYSAAQDSETATTETMEWCESLVDQAFAVLPKEHVDAIHNLTLSDDSTMRRGLAGGNTMILRCVNTNEKELVAVLAHELGHIVDTGLLQAPTTDYRTSFVERGKIVYSSDPSVPMYSVSWEDSRSFTDDARARDFISGYAMSNPYEEFAETYAMYVLHGPLFRFYAAHNRTLAEKYEYMKEVVFEGVEFNFAPEALPKIREVNRRTYDVTRLDYSLESFLTLRETGDSKL